jgi:hypothetical protein
MRLLGREEFLLDKALAKEKKREMNAELRAFHFQRMRERDAKREHMRKQRMEKRAMEQKIAS